MLPFLSMFFVAVTVPGISVNIQDVILHANVIEPLQSRDRGERFLGPGPFFDLPTNNVFIPVAESVKSSSSKTKITYLLGRIPTKFVEIPNQPKSSMKTLGLCAFLVLVVSVGLFHVLEEDGKMVFRREKTKVLSLAAIFALLGLFLVYWAMVESTKYATLWIDNAGNQVVEVFIDDDARAELSSGTHCKLIIKLDNGFVITPDRHEIPISISIKPQTGDLRKERLFLRQGRKYLYNIDALNLYSLLN